MLSSDASEEEPPEVPRLQTGIEGLDRVLGGGLVSDGFVMLGGEPGIGKSTLLLQMVGGLLRKSPARILYVSGEESISQIRARSKRLAIPMSDRVWLATKTEIEEVFELVSELSPQVVIIDSLQTFSTREIDRSPGSVAQVKRVTAHLMKLAKTSGIAVVLIGHITKDGELAGPKNVEHMVDAVLHFEARKKLRCLRASKNRFGSTDEEALFKMGAKGLTSSEK